MHVLIVKTTSLGDIIHTLPAVEDAYRAIPGITFDWLVEAPFAEIPRFHPAVREVIPIRWRHWRKHLGQKQTWQAMIAAVKQLRGREYDYVIDAQGLIKSAIFSTLARGPKAGFSKDCAREPWAAYGYDKTAHVNPLDHAITRVRQLFGQILGYTVDPQVVHYGLTAVEKKSHEKPTVVLLHGTTWPTKHWPEAYWIELAALAHQQGYQVLVPWGNETEHARAEKIAAQGHATVLPKMSLASLAVELKSATGVIAVDTGLGHLAAALDVPCLSLYGPTDPKRTGAWGKYVKYVYSTRECAPCLSDRCAISNMRGPTDPPCLGDFKPSYVWAQWQLLLKEMAS